MKTRQFLVIVAILLLQTVLLVSLLSNESEVDSKLIYNNTSSIDTTLKDLNNEFGILKLMLSQKLYE